MATDRSAQVTWQGSLMDGGGRIDSVGSGAFGPLDVTWASRAEEPAGRTSPEELIAAAHASCFSMAFSARLAKAGTPPDRLEVSAAVTFVPGTGITTSEIDVTGVVPGISEEDFVSLAEDAKENCPVSSALKGNVEMSVSARLAS